ncbi:MAG: ligase-associated DNA damage response endonuclease PdeM [Pseudomonadota bacterium]
MSDVDAIAAQCVTCCGESLDLLAGRAVFWAARRALLLADWHLGKSGVFGRRGLAIPGGDVDADLERLQTMIDRLDIASIWVLGDLMHAPPVAADDWPERVAQFLLANPTVQMAVVAGNHDRVQREHLPASLGQLIDWYTGPVDIGPFRLDHEPDSVAGRFVIAGHLHPTRRLVLGADRLRAPAFWFRRQYAVLPAFGSFTGGHNIRPSGDDRVFVAGPDSVIEVSRR